MILSASTFLYFEYGSLTAWAELASIITAAIVVGFGINEFAAPLLFRWVLMRRKRWPVSVEVTDAKWQGNTIQFEYKVSPRTFTVTERHSPRIYSARAQFELNVTEARSILGEHHVVPDGPLEEQIREGWDAVKDADRNLDETVTRSHFIVFDRRFQTLTQSAAGRRVLREGSLRVDVDCGYRRHSRFVISSPLVTAEGNPGGVPD